MPSNYRYISADIKKQILIMARSLKPLDIARVTNILVRTVYRVVSLTSHTVLGPRTNTCFAHDGKRLSSGTLVIQPQTLTLTRDSGIDDRLHLHAYA